MKYILSLSATLEYILKQMFEYFRISWFRQQVTAHVINAPWQPHPGLFGITLSTYSCSPWPLLFPAETLWVSRRKWCYFTAMDRCLFTATYQLSCKLSGFSTHLLKITSLHRAVLDLPEVYITKIMSWLPLQERPTMLLVRKRFLLSPNSLQPRTKQHTSLLLWYNYSTPSYLPKLSMLSCLGEFTKCKDREDTKQLNSQKITAST